MSSTQGKCSLYLHPDSAVFNTPDETAFIQSLQEIGLISQKINPQQSSNHFFTGNKYLDYIAYMGCAPAIQFEAENSTDDFCFIKVLQFQAAELIFSQKQSRAPHCPACNKPVKNWQQSITDSTINCDQCASTSNIEAFNWRKMAGYSRLFIEITDIFPKEAIPQQSLLDKLADITGCEWVYFYSCK